MTRQIKFKVWNKVEKKWEANIGEWSESGVNAVINTDGRVGQLELLNDELYEWVQFTGLKDKNGKEIYEGDILGYSNAEYGLSGFGGKWVMKWGTEVDDEYGNNAVGYRLPGRKDEVIGNIYENPELIK